MTTAIKKTTKKKPSPEERKNIVDALRVRYENAALSGDSKAKHKQDAQAIFWRGYLNDDTVTLSGIIESLLMMTRISLADFVSDPFTDSLLSIKWDVERALFGDNAVNCDE